MSDGSPDIPVAEDGGQQGRQPNHLLRALLIWVVLAAIFTPFVFYFLGPRMAPGTMSTSAASQQWDMQVLLTFATPIMLLVYTWFGYNLIVFRYKGDDPNANGMWYPRDNIRLQVGWVIGTATIVLFLFAFGWYELAGSRVGAGGGEGPSALYKPDVKTAAVWKPDPKPAMLEVQVIGQQWAWTYRYPQFGGFESQQLYLPVDTWVQFNVTSLDVIHSFWAYQLGVKADANPGVNNIAYTEPLKTGVFNVRCDELCGIWHADMIGTGTVESQSAFYSWAQATEKQLRPLTAQLPPFALTYTPSYTGAGGSYYQGNTAPSGPNQGG